MSGIRRSSEAPESENPMADAHGTDAGTAQHSSYLNMDLDRAHWLSEYLKTIRTDAELHKPFEEAQIRSNAMNQQNTKEGGRIIWESEEPAANNASHESGVQRIDPLDEEGRVRTQREMLEQAFGYTQQTKEKQAFRSFSDLPPPSYREGTIEAAVLAHVGLLLKQDSLEAHKVALWILEEKGLLAPQRWEDIHSQTEPDRRHLLSVIDDSRVNPLVEMAIRKMNLGSSSMILELGCGGGTDLRKLAEVSEGCLIGIDSSQKIIHQAVDITKEKGLSGRIDFGCNEYVQVLEAAQGMEFDGIYACSSMHYFPPAVLRDEIFPLIAGALRQGSDAGILCVALKLADSDSAKSPHQLHLAPGNPYNPSIDLRDRLFRVYFRTKEDLIALIEPSYDIEEVELVRVTGYDAHSEEELFCQISARPKANKR